MHYVHDKYHRRIEPPVSESHENEKRIPKRFCIGKDAVSCQRERSQKVDAEIPELGSGIESADSPLRRTAYCLSVREKKSRNGEALLSPSFLLSVYSLGIMIIAFCGLCPHPTSGIGSEISGNNINALFVMQKKRK